LGHIFCVGEKLPTAEAISKNEKFQIPKRELEFGIL